MNYLFQWGPTVTTSAWLRYGHWVMVASASTRMWDPSVCRSCRARAPRGPGARWRAGALRGVSISDIVHRPTFLTDPNISSRHELNLVLSNGHNWIDCSTTLPLEEGNRPDFRRAVYIFVNTGRWTQSRDEYMLQWNMRLHHNDFSNGMIGNGYNQKICFQS